MLQTFGLRVMVQARHEIYGIVHVNLCIKLTRKLEESLLRRLNEDDSFELRSKPVAFKQTGNMTDKIRHNNVFKYMYTDANIHINETIMTQHMQIYAILCKIIQTHVNALTNKTITTYAKFCRFIHIEEIYKSTNSKYTTPYANVTKDANTQTVTNIEKLAMTNKPVSTKEVQLWQLYTGMIYNRNILNLHKWSRNFTFV